MGEKVLDPASVSLRATCVPSGGLTPGILLTECAPGFRRDEFNRFGSCVSAYHLLPLLLLD